ncbi:hypothetical protein ETU08_00575, partial [Apibacter muscae]|uniref:site-specific integrase n=1 Tax=Apibacter muscae TaxID=2509004 RepID=UPI0011ACE821
MATFHLILRKNKPKADGSIPIIFKIYHADKEKVITTPFSILENQWDNKNKKIRSNHPKAQEINQSLRALTQRLENIITELETEEELDYTVNDIAIRFKEESQNKKVKSMAVYDYFTKDIENYKSTGRLGYAKIVGDSQRSLFKFAKKDLRFKDITYEFLCDYEAFLRKTCDNSSIKIKMRDIRTLYNNAIKTGYARQEDYPFGKSYRIDKRLKSQPRKIALHIEDFRKFKNFDISEHSEYTDTYNMFLFSYYTGGMNYKDMAFLQWSSVKNGNIEYYREKTKEKISPLPIRKEVQKILDYYKEKPKSGGLEYIFPVIYRDEQTDLQKQYRYKKCLRKFNKQLKFIAETTGIKENITSYTARHTQATQLLFSGA